MSKKNALPSALLPDPIRPARGDIAFDNKEVRITVCVPPQNLQNTKTPKTHHPFFSQINFVLL
jgi:hypothetical protein